MARRALGDLVGTGDDLPFRGSRSRGLPPWPLLRLFAFPLRLFPAAAAERHPERCRDHRADHQEHEGAKQDAARAVPSAPTLVRDERRGLTGLRRLSLLRRLLSLACLLSAAGGRGLWLPVLDEALEDPDLNRGLSGMYSLLAALVPEVGICGRYSSPAEAPNADEASTSEAVSASTSAARAPRFLEFGW